MIMKIRNTVHTAVINSLKKSMVRFCELLIFGKSLILKSPGPSPGIWILGKPSKKCYKCYIREGCELLWNKNKKLLH